MDHEVNMRVKCQLLERIPYVDHRVTEHTEFGSLSWYPKRRTEGPRELGGTTITPMVSTASSKWNKVSTRPCSDGLLNVTRTWGAVFTLASMAEEFRCPCPRERYTSYVSISSGSRVFRLGSTKAIIWICLTLLLLKGRRTDWMLTISKSGRRKWCQGRQGQDHGSFLQVQIPFPAVLRTYNRSI